MPHSWWKGKLHTHSYQSFDGMHYPEIVVKQYKDLGYNFLCLSEHVLSAEEDPGISIPGVIRPDRNNIATQTALEEYVRWFPNLVIDNGTDVRLRLLKDYQESPDNRLIEGYQQYLEEPGQFILLQGEEVTGYEGRVVHVGAVNIQMQINPKEPEPNDALEALGYALTEVCSQRNPNQSAIAIYNHPTYEPLVSPQEFKDLTAWEEDRPFPFFELYNGYIGCRDREAAGLYSDESISYMEAWWDSCLTYLIRFENKRPVYALATDDSHCYLPRELYPPPDSSNMAAVLKDTPGHGWIMVRAETLNAEVIIKAMELGDFYCSTGVELEDIQFDGEVLSIQIIEEVGVEFTTEFFGGLLGDPSEIDVEWPGNRGSVQNGERTRRLEDSVNGASAIYQIQGDEIFVRAKVTSSKEKENASYSGEMETGWTQPYIVAATNPTFK